MKKYYKFIFIALFGLFIFIPKDTFADTNTLVTPSTISAWSTESKEASVLPVDFFGKYNTAFYGHNYSLFSPSNGISFGFDNSEIINRLGTVDFLLYSNYVVGGASAPFYRVFISDGDNVSSCTVNNYFIPDGSLIANDGYYTVTCPNVFVTRNIFKVQISYMSEEVSGWVGITPLNFKENSDIDEITSAVQEQTEATKEQTESVKEQTETIKDKDTTESQEQASGFFDDFESNDYGLSDIITMPLTFIKGLSSSTCYALNLPLPFVDTTATLPCMTSIYSIYFGSFLTLYQTITTGIIAYWCCINIFRLVQGFKSPDSDEIEVMDL